MREFIESSLPILIIETGSEKMIRELKALGYVHDQLKNCPLYYLNFRLSNNFRPKDTATVLF